MPPYMASSTLRTLTNERTTSSRGCYRPQDDSNERHRRTALIPISRQSYYQRIDFSLLYWSTARTARPGVTPSTTRPSLTTKTPLTSTQSLWPSSNPRFTGRLPLQPARSALRAAGLRSNRPPKSFKPKLLLPAEVAYFLFAPLRP